MTRAHLHDGLTQLRIRPLFPQHQVQARGQLPGHGHLGDAAMFTHRQAAVEAFQLRIVTCRRRSRFHQQKAQKRTALFADLAQPLFSAAGIFPRNQSEVAAPPLCRRRSAPPAPASAPWPTPSPDRLPDGSAAASPPAAFGLLPPPAGSTRPDPLPARPAFPATAGAARLRTATEATAPVRRVPVSSTTSIFSALPGSTPWPAAGSWCAPGPAPACDDAPAIAAHRALPGSAPRSSETDFPAADAVSASRPADSFSACAPPRPAPPPHLPPTARTPTLATAARTTDSARTPPSPLVLVRKANGKTAPLPRGAANVFPRSRPFGCQRSRPAETQ